MPKIRTRAAICTILTTGTINTGEFDVRSLQAKFYVSSALKNFIFHPIGLLDHAFIFFCYGIIM